MLKYGNLDELTPRQLWHLVDKIKSKTILRDDGCWGWKGSGNPYGQVTLFGKIWRTSRVMCYAVNGPFPLKMAVLHRCVDHPWCCNPEHLYVGTPLDNSLDGQRHRTAVRLHTDGVSDEDIAKVLGNSIDEVRDAIAAFYQRLLVKDKARLP